MASRRRRDLRPAIAVGSVLLLAGVVGAYLIWRGPSEVEALPPAAGVDQATDSGSEATPDRKLASNTPPVQPLVSAPPPATTPTVENAQHRGAAKPEQAKADPKPDPVTPPVKEEPKPEQPVKAPAPREVEDYPADLQGLIRAADQKIQANDPVTARHLLNMALKSDTATEADRESLRSRITKLNADLIFSPTIYKDDPMTEVYTVQSGDSLTRIVPREGLAVETGFVARVNRMANANSLRVGQKLKLVRGPFHAVVTKSAFRMDVFAGNPGEESDWIYIRSFTVGLGEGDSTPVGTFIIRRNSKLINPPWINPRTRDKFGADDPKNPIGERWLGLEGTGASAAYAGYGIHGTIDPDSVGQMKSMGCVRLRTEDIEIVYDMLVEAISTVRIDP